MNTKYEEFKESVMESFLSVEEDILPFSKFKKLLEMPEHRNKTFDQSVWIKQDDKGNAVTFISDNTVNRNFIKIKKDHLPIFNILNKKDDEYEILLSTKKGVAGVYVPSINEDGEKIYYVVCLVYFKPNLISKFPKELEHKEPLQIDKVATIYVYEGNGLASLVYSALADAGYIVVSDSVQYDGGKQLWKKLSKNKDLNVFIYDREHQDVFRDESGEPIKYNTRNLSDDQIWLKGRPGQRFILIAHR